ncbi:hypothetical protein PV328_011837, partial [Microctonus aethiopoides]
MDTPDTLLTKEQRMSIHEDCMFQKHFHGEQLNTELECNHDISDLYNNAMWCKHSLTNQMKYDCNVDTSCSKCEYIHDCFGIIVGMTSDMSQKAKDLMMTLYHMKRHIEGKPFSDDTRNAVMDGEASATKEYSITKTSFTQEMDVSIIQDL